MASIWTSIAWISPWITKCLDQENVPDSCSLSASTPRKGCASFQWAAQPDLAMNFPAFSGRKYGKEYVWKMCVCVCACVCVCGWKRRIFFFFSSNDFSLFELPGQSRTNHQNSVYLLGSRIHLQIGASPSIFNKLFELFCQWGWFQVIKQNKNMSLKAEFARLLLMLYLFRRRVQWKNTKKEV